MSEQTQSLANNSDDPVELKQLSTEELQQRLDAYSLYAGANSQPQAVQDLLNELRVHQIELEMQRRELRESQQELEEAHQRYADLYDFAPVGYLTLDATGCIRDINLAGADLLGQECKGVLGKPFNLWLKQGDNGQAFFTYLKRVRESGRVENIELRLQPKGKGHSEKHVRLETILSHDEIKGELSFRCVIIDVTERMEAEQEIQHQGRQLRLLSDAMPTFIGYVNKEERHQFVNKVYEEWFQMSREQILGKTVEELIGKKSYAEVKEYIHAALAGNPVNFEVAYPPGERNERLFNVSYIPDFADDGTVLGYFTLGQDVTEKRNKELLDKIHMLESARVNRINTMGEMVAELAHELNQPLAAITIYSDAINRMLKQGSKDIPGMSKALDEVRLQAERAGEVIHRLREFVSKRELLIEKVELNQLILEVMNLISVEARWHDTGLCLELGDDITEMGVDRILIEQVILNLARNAIEAMEAVEPNKRVLTIKTRLAYQDSVEFVIEDTGPGIEMDKLERIFEPFYTSKAHGMGMGLAICRNIVRAHNGRLWAITNEGGGTSFTITLPKNN